MPRAVHSCNMNMTIAAASLLQCSTQTSGEIRCKAMAMTEKERNETHPSHIKCHVLSGSNMLPCWKVRTPASMTWDELVLAGIISRGSAKSPQHLRQIRAMDSSAHGTRQQPRQRAEVTNPRADHSGAVWSFGVLGRRSRIHLATIGYHSVCGRI